MQWKNFLQWLLLIIIGGIVFYIVAPKYDYWYRLKPEISAPQIWRANTITGKIEFLNDNNTDWITWVEK